MARTFKPIRAPIKIDRARAMRAAVPVSVKLAGLRAHEQRWIVLGRVVEGERVARQQAFCADDALRRIVQQPMLFKVRLSRPRALRADDERRRAKRQRVAELAPRELVRLRVFQLIRQLVVHLPHSSQSLTRLPAAGLALVCVRRERVFKTPIRSNPMTSNSAASQGPRSLSKPDPW